MKSPVRLRPGFSAPVERASLSRRPPFQGRDGGAGPDARLNGRAILREDDWQGIGRRLSLSPRELELVQRIFEGKKLTAIAQDMGLALGTVKTYCQRVHLKLQVSNQRELILVILCCHLTT
jgi:DNA-binding NarL/FixJ family response regulator